MTNILNRGFSRLPDDALVSKVMVIIVALTGSVNFPIIDPTLLVLQGALDALTQAMAIRGPARETAVAAARRTLEQHLEDLADNLEKTANNDPVKLATTGFDVRKETTQTAEPPDIPANVRLKTTGVSGEVQLLFEPSTRARSYQIQISLDPNAGPWTDYDTVSSTRRIILAGQPRAKDIWVRVRAIGPNNTKSGWSDPATILVN